MPSQTMGRALTAGVVAVAAGLTPATVAAHVGPQIAGQSAGEAGRAATFFLRLDGEQVPTGGDGDGRGYAVLRLDPRRETVCHVSGWRHLDGRVTAMHIHKAASGATGPHHIDLFNDADHPGGRAVVKDCVEVHDGGHGTTLSAKEKIRAVIDDPGGYYLNIHSTAFPPGAIRGQLG